MVDEAENCGAVDRDARATAKQVSRLHHLHRVLRAEPTRFLLVGGANTLIGFALYAGLWVTLGAAIGYLACLYLSYAGAVGLAYLLHRRFVFRRADRGLAQFLRFASVYLVSLAINTLALPVLVLGLGLQPLIAQAAAVLLTTSISYLGHKFFSFRAPTRQTTQKRRP